MTPEQLQHKIEENQSKDRTFVGLALHGIGVSAFVNMSINVPGGKLTNPSFY